MVKAVPVLTVVKPVIQLALVAVNSASMREMPLVVILGMESRTVPTSINMKKESNISTGGLILCRPIRPLTFVNSISTMIRK